VARHLLLLLGGEERVALDLAEVRLEGIGSGERPRIEAGPDAVFFALARPRLGLATAVDPVAREVVLFFRGTLFSGV
jgi:hypothetical protein